MSVGWSIYVAGALTALAVFLSQRTGDPYTDQPVAGCVLGALIWPLVVAMLVAAWITGDLD